MASNPPGDTTATLCSPDKCCLTRCALEALEKLYGNSLRLTESHVVGPSPACRDESLLTLARTRHALVCRFGIDDGSGKPDDLVGIAHFRPIPDDVGLDEFDRWNLGIAEGFFRPPGLWNDRARVPLLSDKYAAILGHRDCSIDTIPYSSQHYASGSCTTACLYAALLALCVRCSEPPSTTGPFSMSCMAKELAYELEAGVLRDALLGADYTLPEEIRGANEESLREHQSHAREWRAPADSLHLIGGVPLEAVQPLLAKLVTRYDLSCYSSFYAQELGQDDCLEYLCVLESYISSGFPVLARVDIDGLEGWVGIPEFLHTVLVLGRDGLLGEDGGSVLYHDPAFGPLRERRARDFYEAAKTRLSQSEDPRFREDARAKVVAIVPRPVTFAPKAALEAYELYVNTALPRLLRVLNQTHQVPSCEYSRWRARLVPTDLVDRVYLAGHMQSVEHVQQLLPRNESRTTLCLELYVEPPTIPGAEPSCVAFFNPDEPALRREQPQYDPPTGIIFQDTGHSLTCVRGPAFAMSQPGDSHLFERDVIGQLIAKELHEFDDWIL